MSEVDIILQIEREGREATARVLALLRSEGRPDLALDLEHKLKEVALGVTAAKSIWHSITPAQRRLLEVMEPGRTLVMPPHSRTRYIAVGEPGALGDVCGLGTVRALCQRDLLAPAGGAFTPERRVVLTDHGRFVLAKGRPA